MSRPGREGFYSSNSEFPKIIGSEMQELDNVLDEQLVRFCSLADRYIAYIGYLKEGGHEPKGFTFENVAGSHSSIEGVLEVNLDAVPAKLVELFRCFDYLKETPWKIKIERESTVKSLGVAFNTDKTRHPVAEEFHRSPKFSKVEIELRNCTTYDGLIFEIWFDHYAHHSRHSSSPPEYGYYLGIREKEFGKRTGHVLTLLNSPLYTSVRYGVFESLHYWLDDMLAQEKVRLDQK